MNEKSPQSNPKRLEMVSLGEAVDKYKLRIRQREEMLREGKTVEYHGLKLEYIGENERQSSLIRLRNPESESIMEIPAEMLAEEGWRLEPEEKSETVKDKIFSNADLEQLGLDDEGK